VTNSVGSTYQEFTVFVAQSSSLALREGVNEYTHAGTFIRGDIPTTNSGVRDQIIVGRNNAALRGLLAFDVSQIPAGATIHSVTLDLWSVAAGSGTLLTTLGLHELLTNFAEGTGDGSSAANGAGTGADWPTRTGNAAESWTAAGAASGTDYETAPLATLAGFDPSTAPVGSQYTFSSTTALVSAVSGVAGTSAPLGLMLKMANDTTGGSVFARFGSDNHANNTQRPLLTIGYTVNHTPEPTTGTAPAAQTGVAAALGGSSTNATSSIWSLVSGPGTAAFGNAADATTTVTFSHPGIYQLRLSAANAFGETSAMLAVSVTDPPAADPFALWAAGQFNLTELADPGISGPNATPAGDGLSNLLKYALGLPAKTPSTSGITLAESNGVWHLTYRRPSNRPDLVYNVEISPDLEPGSWTTGGVTHQRVATGEMETWQGSCTPSAGDEKMFLRLHVSKH
jgi:hypothetical protein